jgi:hypothetical protein
MVEIGGEVRILACGLWKGNNSVLNKSFKAILLY